MTITQVLNTAVTLDPRVLVPLSSLLAMATALVTDRLASSRTRALTLIFLSVVTAIVAGWQENGALSFVVGDVLWTAFSLFMTGALVHFGLLKPLRVTGTDGVIQQVMPRGLGSQMQSPGGYRATSTPE